MSIPHTVSFLAPKPLLDGTNIAMGVLELDGQKVQDDNLFQRMF